MPAIRPELCLAKAALILAAALAPSAAEAFPVFRTHVTNGSQYPLLGLELVTVDPGSSTPSARTPIYLDEPLMPGETVKVSQPMDEAVLARGGKQQLRWYWTSDRACWGYLVAMPSELHGGANTGAHFCQGGKTPAAPTVAPQARMAAVDAIAERGDLPGAIFEVNAVMAQYPDQPQLHHRRGELYLMAGLPHRAEEDFRAETGVDTGHSFHDMAMVHYARGDGARALEMLTGAVSHSPDNLQYLSDRAQLSCLAGDLEQMRKDETEIVAKGGPSPPPRAPDCSPMESGW